MKEDKEIFTSEEAEYIYKRAFTDGFKAAVILHAGALLLGVLIGVLIDIFNLV